MKKLTIILVVLMLVVTFAVQAQDGPKFGFMELFIGSVNDSFQTHNNDAGTDANGGGWVANVYDASMSLPISSIDGVDSSVFFFFESSMGVTSGDFEWLFQPQFKFSDVYTLNCGINEWVYVDYTNLSTFSFTRERFDVFADNNINIPDVMTIWLNFMGTFNIYPDGSDTTIDLQGELSLGGPGNPNVRQGVIFEGDDIMWWHYVGPQYDNGIGWSISQEYHFNLDVVNWKDNYSSTDNSWASNGLLNNLTISNYVAFIWDFMKLANVENFGLHLVLLQYMQMVIPWSIGPEESKTFTTYGLYGMEMKFHGFTVGLYAYLQTSDSYNTGVPFDGHAGSDKDYYDSSATRANPTGSIGPSVKLEWWGSNWGGTNIAFRMHWDGQYQFRDYLNESNSRTSWTNAIRADWFVFF